MTVQAPLDEEASIRTRFWKIKARQVVVDVGSFAGSYAIPALNAGATVYAIDARETTLADLRSAVKAFDVEDRHLKTIHAAVFDGGEYPPELVAAIGGCQYLTGRDMTPDAGVTWTTLDDLLKGVKPSRVDHVKVDVEGGELGVLKGAKWALKRFRPRLVIEDHSRVYPWVAEQESTAGILRLLAKLGYGLELVSHAYADYVIGTPR